MNRKLDRLANIALLVVLAFLSVRFAARANDEPKEPVADQSVGPVAVLDVARIFKESAAFSEDVAVIREGVEESQREFAKQNAALSLIIAGHKQLTPGSKEYLDLEQQIATEKAKLQAQIKRRQAQAVSQEAEAYARNYEDLQQVVNEYAKLHGIRLVLRQNTREMNLDDPKSVLNTLNRFIIFEDRLDITDAIIESLNKD